MAMSCCAMASRYAAIASIFVVSTLVILSLDVFNYARGLVHRDAGQVTGSKSNSVVSLDVYLPWVRKDDRFMIVST